ncbi:MAG: hypothetical protein K8T91_09530 [Planctomycetes bacterium]|nr:hypothetical protein [Planctomycetota bacterium]
MTILKATIQSGRLEIVAPPEWPDGTQVEIYPFTHASNGTSDSLSAQEIATTLTAMDRCQPLEITAAEQAAW